MNYELNPRVANLRKHDPNDDDRPQIPVTANKIFPKQDIGVRFKDINNMIFVSAIAVDSIFKDTDIELGDRVVGVTGMNFMSYGNSHYAMQLISKAQKEVTLVVEKEYDVFRMDKDVDPAHNTAWADVSGHEDKKNYPMSPGKYIADNEYSENTDSEDDNLSKILARGGHSTPTSNKKPSTSNIKKGRNIKTGSSHKSPKADTKPKSFKKSPGSSIHSSSAHSKARSISIHDTDDSSIGDFAEEESKLKVAVNHLLSPNSRSLSKLNQSASSSKSVAFDFDNFDGDYLKVTVRKDSEALPGISIQKTEGKFILTAVPAHEKRIFVGMQVLAINGVVNIHTVAKAEDLINRAKGETKLILDMSSPWEPNIACPCCQRPITLDGEHINGVMNRRPTRGRADEASISGSVEISVAESEITARVANKAPPGLRVARIPERPAKYQLDDFDSDSDEEEVRNRQPKRGSVNRYQPNDKFMIRVSKAGKGKQPGIELFDHKGTIYVSRLEESGLFYSTPIMVGDKVLSVNGRKVSLLKTAANAANIIEERDSVSLFVLRSDPNDRDFKEAVALFPP